MFNANFFFLIVILILLTYLLGFRPKDKGRLEIMLLGIEITIFGGFLLISPINPLFFELYYVTIVLGLAITLIGFFRK